MAGLIIGMAMGCTSVQRGAEVDRFDLLSASDKEQIHYACDDLSTREALDEICGGQATSHVSSVVTDFHAEVWHTVTMRRRVHPAVALNAATLVVGYFVFFFRVESDVVSNVTVKWRDGEQENFIFTRHEHYFHPGYLPSPSDPAKRRILYYEDVQASELRLAGREVAIQLLHRYATRKCGPARNSSMLRSTGD
jgi:hypothetical protein